MTTHIALVFALLMRVPVPLRSRSALTLLPLGGEEQRTLRRTRTGGFIAARTLAL